MPSSNTKPVSKRIELLFTRFAAFYGHLWRSQFKSDEFFQFAKKEWEAALSGFSDEVLNTAILETRDFFEMPPTLPQLIQSCRRIRNRNPAKQAQEAELPQTPEVRIANVAQCMKYLK